MIGGLVPRYWRLGAEREADSGLPFRFLAE